MGSVRPNKEVKLTEPSIMELRSLSPVLGGPDVAGRGTEGALCSGWRGR